MAVTLKQIAEHTGLSRQAVGFILNDEGSFKAETRDRVMRAARELGYRPNYAAQALQKNRFNAIALLQATHSYRSLVQGELICSIAQTAERMGQHMSLSTVTDEAFDNAEIAPKALRELMVDGLIINLNINIPQAMLDLIRKNHIPTVWLNARRPNDAVRPDDFGAARDLTRRMIRKGHKRVAYIDSAHTTVYIHYSRRDRYEGYRSAMKEAGLKPPCKPYLGTTGSPPSEFAGYIADILSAETRPDAVLTYGDSDLEMVYRSAIVDHGLGVPNDLLLGSFSHVSVDTSLPFMHCVWPAWEIGEAAVDMLLKKIERPSTPMKSKALAWSVADKT